MSITLICPGCKTRLSVGEDRAGTTFDCPKCFTRISVPVIERATPPAPAPEPVREIDYEPEPESAPEPDRPRERDYEPDPDYVPRRRKKSGVNMIAVTGVAILGVLALIMVIVAVSARRDRTDAHKAKRGEPSGARASTGTERPRADAPRGSDSRTTGEGVRDDSTVDGAREGGRVIVGLLLLVFGLAFYLAPTIIAIARGHNNIAPIAVVNFFLGWLLIGWVIALAWAFTDLKQLERKRRSYL
jgi:hypothetical protein